MPVARAFLEFDYVLKSERDLPPEKQTVFRLKPLTLREQSECERVDVWVDKSGAGHQVMDRKELARKQLTFGLVGWRNFLDENGKAVEFRRVSEGNRFALPEETLNLITPWAVEIANAIDEASEISETAAKNC